MRKNTTFICLLLAVNVGLAACGSAASPNTASQASENLLSADYENALSIPMQLAVGTLKLDGTQNEVDASMAADMLPLWKAVRSLSGSDTVAEGEIQALFKQIQETMTPEQIQAIATMQMTREDMAQMAEKLGLQFGPGGGRFENLSPEMQATIQAARESGQAPPGGFGGGLGGGPEGFGPGGGAPNQAASPEQLATAEARRASARNSIGIPVPILEAVIKYLEAKL